MSATEGVEESLISRTGAFGTHAQLGGLQIGNGMAEARLQRTRVEESGWF